MSRMSDLGIATTDNFESMGFEQKFRILANKYGVAGEEFLSGGIIDLNQRLEYPDGDELVPDTRIEDTTKMLQKIHDEHYRQRYNEYLDEKIKYKNSF
jgi:hypothetical protein